MGPPQGSWTTAVVVAVCLAAPIAAHVALTFPPARKYDLDFLDNSRTKAPCGMPKGELLFNYFVIWTSSDKLYLFEEDQISRSN